MDAFQSLRACPPVALPLSILAALRPERAASLAKDATYVGIGFAVPIENAAAAAGVSPF